MESIVNLLQWMRKWNNKYMRLLLIESVRTMDYVTGVDWSEMVGVVGDNNSEVVQAFFAK